MERKCHFIEDKEDRSLVLYGSKHKVSTIYSEWNEFVVGSIFYGLTFYVE